MQSEQTKMIPTIKSILKKEGWLGFYRGANINAARVAIKQFYRWPLNITISRLYHNVAPNANEIIRQVLTGFTISFT
jgi:hypothetical protein